MLNGLFKRFVEIHYAALLNSQPLVFTQTSRILDFIGYSMSYLLFFFSKMLTIIEYCRIDVGKRIVAIDKHNDLEAECSFLQRKLVV